MRKVFIPVATTIIAVMLASCNAMKEPKQMTIDQKNAIEDSLPKIFPTAVTLHTIQDEDYNIKLVIGDAKFYPSSPAQYQAAAIRTGAMLINVLGADCGVRKATLVITKDTRNNVEDPKDGISTDMKIDSFEKAGTK